MIWKCGMGGTSKFSVTFLHHAIYALSQLQICIVKFLKDYGKKIFSSCHENYKANGWTWNSKKMVVIASYSIYMLPSNLWTTPCCGIFEQTTPIEDLYTMLWSFVISVGSYYTFDSKLVESSVASHNVI